MPTPMKYRVVGFHTGNIYGLFDYKDEAKSFVKECSEEEHVSEKTYLVQRNDKDSRQK